MYRKIELCGHIECTKLRISNKKLCTLNIRIVWIRRNLNILNCLNSTGNFILYMYEFFEFTKNLNSVDTLNVWNCVNLSGNYVDYIYGMSGFEEKLNIQNWVNSMRNYVQM